MTGFLLMQFHELELKKCNAYFVLFSIFAAQNKMSKLKKILSLLLLLLYVGYYVSTVCFYHLHVVDGELAMHSHLHKESHHNSDNGGHTKQDLMVIAHVSHFDVTVFSCDYTINPQQFQFLEDIFTETTPHLVSEYFRNLSLRAPPVLA